MLHIEDTDYNPKLLHQSGDEVKASKLEVLKIQKVIQSRFGVTGYLIYGIDYSIFKINYFETSYYNEIWRQYARRGWCVHRQNN